MDDIKMVVSYVYSFDAYYRKRYSTWINGRRGNECKEKKVKEKERTVEKERQMSPGYLVGSKEITVTLRRGRERERE